MKKIREKIQLYIVHEEDEREDSADKAAKEVKQPAPKEEVRLRVHDIYQNELDHDISAANSEISDLLCNIDADYLLPVHSTPDKSFM